MPSGAPEEREGRAVSGAQLGARAPAATRADGLGGARNRRHASGRSRCVPSDSNRASRTSAGARASPNARPPRGKADSRGHLPAAGPDLTFFAARITNEERPEAFVDPAVEILRLVEDLCLPQSGPSLLRLRIKG